MAFGLRSRAAVLVAAAGMTLVPALDALIGLSTGDLVTTVGPTVTATATLVAIGASLRSDR